MSTSAELLSVIGPSSSSSSNPTDRQSLLEPFVVIIRLRNEQETLESYFENISVDDFVEDISTLANQFQFAPLEAATFLKQEVEKISPKSLKAINLLHELLTTRVSIQQLIQTQHNQEQFNLAMKTFAETMNTLLQTQQETTTSLRNRIASQDQTVSISNIAQQTNEVDQLKNRISAVESKVKLVFNIALGVAISYAPGYLWGVATTGLSAMSNFFTNSTLTDGL